MAKVITYPEEKGCHQDGRKRGCNHNHEDTIKRCSIEHIWQFRAIEVLKEFKMVEISDNIGKEEDTKALNKEENDGHHLQTLHTLFLF